MSVGKSFLLGLAQAAPGAFVIPTTARISRNELSEISKSDAEGCVQFAGFVTGTLVELAGAIYCLNHNYDRVFGAFAITNATSGIYEVGRRVLNRTRDRIAEGRMLEIAERARSQYRKDQYQP